MEPEASAVAAQSGQSETRPPWYHPTPGKVLGVLVAVEGGLLVSQQFRWFAFNHKAGYAVLFSLAAVAVFFAIMLLWFLAALVFRVRFQFSLRSLLILVVAVAVPSSWFATERQRATRQRESLERLARVIYPDGFPPAPQCRWLSFDYQLDRAGNRLDNAVLPGPGWLHELLGEDFFRVATKIHMSGSHISAAQLEPLEGLSQLQSLNLSSTMVTRAGLRHLKDLTKLQELWLFRASELTDLGCLGDLRQLELLWLTGTKITDAGLEPLEKLTQLLSLSVESAEITDAGLIHLRGLRRLESLSLECSEVTDAGLEHLEGLSQLRSLSLVETDVTDAGLEHLSALTRLKYLDLRRTWVTKEGVETLRQALPGCRISR